jgi:hypothetical protein
VDIPEILEAVFPKNVGMLYLYGLALHSQITVKFLNFWMGCCFAGNPLLRKRLGED